MFQKTATYALKNIKYGLKKKNMVRKEKLKGLLIKRYILQRSSLSGFQRQSHVFSQTKYF